MAAKKCRFGKVKTGKRKGACRKQKLSGAAAKRGRRKAGARRAAGSFCIAKQDHNGKSSKSCFRSQSSMEAALNRIYSSSKTYKSILLYSRKRA